MYEGPIQVFEKDKKKNSIVNKKPLCIHIILRTDFILAIKLKPELDRVDILNEIKISVINLLYLITFFGRQ